jgi:stage III sporulation protein AF
MTAYILRVVGVAVLSVIVSVLLSESKISKHVKSVMALVIVFIIVAPIPKMINDFRNGGGISLGSGGNLVDENYVHEFNEKRAKQMEDIIKKALTDADMKVDIKITIDTEKTEFTIIKVDVIKNGQILTDKQKETIKTLISAITYVKDTSINFI